MARSDRLLSAAGWIAAAVFFQFWIQAKAEHAATPRRLSAHTSATFHALSASDQEAILDAMVVRFYGQDAAELRKGFRDLLETDKNASHSLDGLTDAAKTIYAHVE